MWDDARDCSQFLRSEQAVFVKYLALTIQATKVEERMKDLVLSFLAQSEKERKQNWRTEGVAQ